jgi:hypothetical protein
MAIKLSECSPSLHAAIMAQLKKEGRHLPQTIIRYCLGYTICGKWQFGPETENLALVSKQAAKMQQATGRSAYLTSIGKPPAVVVKLTRVTQPMESKEVSK